MHRFTDVATPSCFLRDAILKAAKIVRVTVSAGTTYLKEKYSRARLRESIQYLNAHLLQDVGLTIDDVETLYPKFPSGGVDRTRLP